MRKIILMLVAVLLAGSAAFAAAAVPEAVNYQGTLRSAGEEPVTDPVQIIYRIYDAATLGNILWAETLTVDPNNDGQFSTILGKVHAINQTVMNGDGRWLAMAVGTDEEMSPRTEMVSSAYSFRVATIDKAAGGEVAGALTLVQTADRAENPTLTLATQEGDTVQFCPIDCGIMRATNSNGEEVFTIGIDQFDESVFMIAKGPGGDESETMMTSSGVTLSAGVARAAQKVISLDVNEGAVFLSRANPDDTVVVINHDVFEGARVTVSDPSTGEQTVFSTGQSAVTVYDANQNVQLTMGVDPDGGGTVNVYDGTAKEAWASNKLMTLSKNGVSVYDETGTTELATLKANGDFNSVAKIAVGEGCTADGDWSVVFGFGNTASGDSSTVSGGFLNTASARIATIGGGGNNTASGEASTISGGYENQASQRYSTVGGGVGNLADSSYSVVAGGYVDTCYGDLSAIVGGLSNKIDNAGGSFIGGGHDNTIQDSAAGSYIYGATLAGGNANFITGSYATIAGGSSNIAGAGGAFVGGGYENKALGGWSTIPGGWYNLASATGSYAAGYAARSEGQGSMVFNAYYGAPDNYFTCQNSNMIAMRAISNFYFSNVSGVPDTAKQDGSKFFNTSTGAYLTTGGVWTDAPKFRGAIPADSKGILSALEQLPINRWTAEEDGSVAHIGPLPEDFRAVFGLGRDDGSISAGDLAGVALAAIQELQRKTQELAEVKQRLEENEIMLTQLSAMVEVILAQQQGSGSEGIDLADNR